MTMYRWTLADASDGANPVDVPIAEGTADDDRQATRHALDCLDVILDDQGLTAADLHLGPHGATSMQATYTLSDGSAIRLTVAGEE